MRRSQVIGESHGIHLLAAWWRNCWHTVLLCAAILLFFTGLHLLSGGHVQEIGYALLLSLLLCLGAAIGSLLSLRRQLRQLEKTLQVMPEESAMLPLATRPAEKAWRRLTLAYLSRGHQAQEAAEKQRRDAEDYFTLWLHQMKIPLAALDLLAQSEQPVDRALMRQELLKARQYADMALTYQRLGSMAHDLMPEQVAVYPLCCACARQLMPLFRYGQLTLALEPFPGSVLTDRKWLSVVITQVLTNAIKYTPRGGRITIDMPKAGILEIRDTGIGVQAQDIPRVFERGFTGCAGRSHEKSTGIGLYLCKEIMDRLHHGIALESRIGEGTVVRLDLRREKALEEV